MSSRSTTNFRIASRFFAVSLISVLGRRMILLDFLEHFRAGLSGSICFAASAKTSCSCFQFREADLQNSCGRQIDQFGLGQNAAVFFFAQCPLPGRFREASLSGANLRIRLVPEMPCDWRARRLALSFSSFKPLSASTRSFF